MILWINNVGWKYWRDTGRRVTDAQQEELKRSRLKQNTVVIEGFKALTVKSTNYQRVFSLDTNCALNCWEILDKVDRFDSGIDYREPYVKTT